MHALRPIRLLGNRGPLVIVATALMLLLPVPPASAATITVNTLDDELNSDGDCSLREAIEAANTNAAVDSCAAGDSDPIVDVITFGVAGVIAVGSTLPISEVVTIDGPGAASLTISGGHTVRVMEVDVGATLNLEGTTVADGAAPLFGGVFAAAGILNLGTLNVANSTLSGGSAQDYAGAIGNFGATLSITDSTLTGNSAQQGGAIWSDGSVTITNSTLWGNSADAGGAIYNVGSLSITNSTLWGNSAAGPGGAINVTGGAPTLTNSTLSGNSAAQGGAINAFNNRVVTLQNTIVANSPSGGNCWSEAPIVDGGGNMQNPGADCGATITSADPQLDPAGLQNNGGPTQTIAIQAGSPAIDAAVANNCPAADQRGVARPQGAGCDIGAFELEPTIQTVTIDIKPGPGDRVSLSRTRVSVAIITNDTFDATQVDFSSVCFGDAEERSERDCTPEGRRGRKVDVDGDGELDLVLRFRTSETGIDLGDTQACMTGTKGGEPFEGCGSVTVVP